MKPILFITTTLLCGSAIAQPTLTAANMNPAPANVYTLTQCDTTGLVAASTDPGAGKTWNYSFITPISHISSALAGPYVWSVLTFMNCSATPYCDSFPGATIAYERYDSLFGGGSDLSYEYFLTNAHQYSDMGFAYNDAPYGISVYYFNPHVPVLTYPITYLSRSIDTSYYFNDGGEESARTTDTVTADAYGTIKLPSGTYTNALRVHKITFQADTFYFGGTETLNNYTYDTYDWFIPGFHAPIFEIQNDTLGGVPENVYYYTGTFDSSVLPSGVHNIAPVLQDVTAYPNPAFDQLHITYTSLTGQPATISLTDIVGKCINTISIDNPVTGVNETTISVSALPSGIYFLRVQSGGNVASRKINVVR